MTMQRITFEVPQEDNDPGFDLAHVENEAQRRGLSLGREDVTIEPVDVRTARVAFDVETAMDPSRLLDIVIEMGNALAIDDFDENSACVSYIE